MAGPLMADARRVAPPPSANAEAASDARAADGGMTATAGQEAVLETALLLTALHARYGADFRGFNPLVIRTKLEELVARRGAPHISALQGDLLRDEQLGHDVIRLLSTGHSACANDSHLLTALRFAIVPILRSSPWPAIWIADCIDTDLVVLIAAMLKEEGQLERTQLYVTSADERLMAELTQLRLAAAEVEQLEARHLANGGHGSVRACLAIDGDGFVLSPNVQAALTCHVHDLASDASFREFETVVCARPLREYGFALQQRALGIFSDSLCGFGVLQIDPSSAMRTLASDFCFAPVLPGQGLYRRLPR